MLKHVGSSPWKFPEKRLVFEEPSSQRNPVDGGGDAQVPAREQSPLAETVQQLGNTLQEFINQKKKTEREQLAKQVHKLLEQVKSQIEGAPDAAKRMLKEKWAEVQQYSQELLGALPEGLREEMTLTIEFVKKHVGNISQDVRGQIQNTLNFSEAIGKKVGTLFAGVKLPEWMQAFFKDTQEFGAWIGRTVQGFIDNFLIGLDEKDATGKYKNPWLRTLFAAQIPAAKKRVDEAAKGATPESMAAQSRSPEAPPQISLDQFQLSAPWKVGEAKPVPASGLSFRIEAQEGGKRLNMHRRPDGKWEVKIGSERYEVSIATTDNKGSKLLFLPRVEGNALSKSEVIFQHEEGGTKGELRYSLQALEAMRGERKTPANDIVVTIVHVPSVSK